MGWEGRVENYKCPIFYVLIREGGLVVSLIRTMSSKYAVYFLEGFPQTKQKFCHFHRKQVPPNLISSVKVRDGDEGYRFVDNMSIYDSTHNLNLTKLTSIPCIVISIQY